MDLWSDDRQFLSQINSLTLTQWLRKLSSSPGLHGGLEAFVSVQDFISSLLNVLDGLEDLDVLWRRDAVGKVGDA